MKWVVLKEVIERSQGGAFEKEPDQVNIEILSDAEGGLKFVSPEQEGEYRLFCYVFDGNIKAGTANFPFRIK